MVKSPILPRAEKHIAMDKKLLMHYNKSRTPLYRRKNSCHKGDFLWQEKQYEKEIFELKEQGLSQRQIGERLGISYEKMQDFF